jgi:putative transposase
MVDIVALFQCTRPSVTATTVRQLSRISVAMMAMTGRVTMLGRARWAGKGGSYRTVQRFFSTVIPWAMLFWVFFRHHVYRADDVSLLGGDAVVVTKAGTHTHGLDRFFASWYGKPGPGLAFFTLSLISLQARRSFPVRVEQVIRSDAEKAVSNAKAAAKKARSSMAKRRPGRPKGSQNTTKADVQLTPELVRITSMIEALLHLIAACIPVTYLGWDGHFGNRNALRTAQEGHLYLISKRRADSALYGPYDGPHAGPGPRRKYGSKVAYAHLPEQCLKETTGAGPIQIRLYQAQLLHKECAQPLNVGISVKTNLRTQAQAHVLLFSSDLTLAYASLVDSYGLRFHIEFNFRDAKQYWGLEDFMNVTPTGVTNAASLSLCMVNVAYRLQADRRQHDPDYSILDLKADCRGSKDVEEMLQMLPEKPEPILLRQMLNKVACLGCIHAVRPSFSLS